LATYILMMMKLKNKWSIEEDIQLFNEIDDFYEIDYNKLASSHKRTEEEIMIRIIKKLIYPLYLVNGHTVKYAEEYNIPTEFLLKHIALEKYKK